MSNLKPIIEESFRQYAGAVLQSRALVDVRDCLKPSARQIFYCLHTDKFVHSKPFKKTLKGIGSAMRMYIHGDSSCAGVMMRAGQPFAMRYPLMEIEGSYGNLIESGNWAHPRYTSSRLSEVSNALFEDIAKETIEEWRLNYDDTEKYPAVLSSKGYYNIVNGTMGIGVGAASSIPSFNLREVNEALVKLLWDPEISFEEIYCAPDFPTGALLLNEEEVKESLRTGQGKACKLRSVVEYDEKERVLIVREIPYGVYTNTICKEMEEILNGEENPGIDRFNDLTGANPLIKIYLTKKGNPDRVLRFLYKNTSLQYHYGINMTMLEEGRYPRVFSWKEALSAHLAHQIEVYRRSFLFDLKKLKDRLHIVRGILIALDNIEEVIQIIKSSTSASLAADALMERFSLSKVQVKAILDMKLSRLAHLEVNKFKEEESKLLIEISHIEEILNDEVLLKKEVETGYLEFARKFGDARRTEISNIEKEESEPTEIVKYQLNLTNMGNVFVSEISSLLTQRRGGVGTKFKLSEGEFISSTTTAETNETIFFFTKRGNCYNYKVNLLPIEEKFYIEELFTIPSYDSICEMISYNRKKEKKKIIFLTKRGMLKKSDLSEYNTKRKIGLKAIDLGEDDEIRSVLFTDEGRVGMVTIEGNFIMCETSSIKSTGRVSKGVKGIKLNEGDELAYSKIIPKNTKKLVSITREGFIKSTPIEEFSVTGRYTKGTKLQKIEEGDSLVDFLPVVDESSVVVVSSKSQIKIKLSEVPVLTRNTHGARSIKTSEKTKVIGISKF